MFDKLGNLFDMQAKLKEMQEGLRQRQVEVSTGGGMVKMTANGLNEILSVQIDDELINMQDRAVLEDLIAAATNEVQRKVKDLAQEEMVKLTGMKIPGLF